MKGNPIPLLFHLWQELLTSDLFWILCYMKLVKLSTNCYSYVFPWVIQVHALFLRFFFLFMKMIWDMLIYLKGQDLNSILHISDASYEVSDEGMIEVRKGEWLRGECFSFDLWHMRCCLAFWLIWKGKLSSVVVDGVCCGNSTTNLQPLYASYPFSWRIFRRWHICT